MCSSRKALKAILEALVISRIGVSVCGWTRRVASARAFFATEKAGAASTDQSTVVLGPLFVQRGALGIGEYGRTAVRDEIPVEVEEAKELV